MRSPQSRLRLPQFQRGLLAACHPKLSRGRLVECTQRATPQLADALRRTASFRHFDVGRAVSQRSITRAAASRFVPWTVSGFFGLSFSNSRIPKCRLGNCRQPLPKTRHFMVHHLAIARSTRNLLGSSNVKAPDFGFVEMNGFPLIALTRSSTNAAPQLKGRSAS